MINSRNIVTTGDKTHVSTHSKHACHARMQAQSALACVGRVGFFSYFLTWLLVDIYVPVKVRFFFFLLHDNGTLPTLPGGWRKVGKVGGRVLRHDAYQTTCAPGTYTFPKWDRGEHERLSRLFQTRLCFQT